MFFNACFVDLQIRAGAGLSFEELQAMMHDAALINYLVTLH